uniref:Uncharacterized protein n=1 Tax=Octactis speculum TaxID=3111310 RepID=A0A7S2HL03_9STRA|mmetsp:Transcript_7398/g.9161  ORF Transcript_7398/g.9161 Transcript_7398/m.9161 type:complete len:180 (+) Transcript_7398:71-610(+)|eukprot:CAMPEP_0185781598 /NCGR_PEP_ID=MMETSP1174-20130828/102978_1 /TAXON_ID=35687 /ORGANISM="Dictyocha speculum, Strain CCMP1381" /LENGTH=179 /DNA_ID=CAMNT_0028471647 /DNA_START=71 /DNA_END=610 /DNA_ORIENTATION=-
MGASISTGCPCGIVEEHEAEPKLESISSSVSIKSNDVEEFDAEDDSTVTTQTEAKEEVIEKEDVIENEEAIEKEEVIAKAVDPELYSRRDIAKEHLDEVLADVRELEESLAQEKSKLQNAKKRSSVAYKPAIGMTPSYVAIEKEGKIIAEEIEHRKNDLKQAQKLYDDAEVAISNAGNA